MVDLVFSIGIQIGGPPLVRTSIYCWPCDAVHEFDLEEVEQVVHALAVEIVHQRDSERVLPDSPADLDPPCLNEALRWAGDGYADHVADSITRREQDAIRADGFENGRKIGQAEREAELLEQGWTPPGAVLESVLEPARNEIHAYEVWRDALNLAAQTPTEQPDDLVDPFGPGSRFQQIKTEARWFWDRLLEGPPGFEGVYMRFPEGEPDPRERATADGDVQSEPRMGTGND